MNIKHVEVLREVEARFVSGNSIPVERVHITRAEFDTIAALSAPAEAQPCGCGEATCTVPWEPGCGLGKSEQHVEAQPVGVDGVEAALQKWLDWCIEHNEEPEAKSGARIAIEALAKSVAPVGVEGLAGAQAFLDWNRRQSEPPVRVGQEYAVYGAALAQQPASDGGFTAADMMDARQEGRKEAQQPAAVDSQIATLQKLVCDLTGNPNFDFSSLDYSGQ